VRQPLGDVVVRARGLALHLLSQRALEQLARSAGSGVLAGALQGVGYPAAPAGEQPAASAAERIDDDIEREVARRLGVLARWLGRRRAQPFAGVFEDEQRRVLREVLRRLAAGGDPARLPSAWWLRRRLRGALAAAREPAELARVLSRNGSPYGPPLELAIRRQGVDLPQIEGALDATWAGRAGRAAARVRGRLRDWVAEGIDLENAWDALLQGGGEFLPGGARLSRAQHAAVAEEPDPRARRRRLAALLGTIGRDALADPERPLATLEARALNARIAREQRCARAEPLGASPILWVVLRLRRERADLRRINAAVALGLPAADVVAQLSAAS
jgi:hypothetical protein